MLQPSRFATYKDIVWLIFKYGNSDLVQQTGIRAQVEIDSDQEGSGSPEELCADLEAMGPAFIKLGQLLSTRGDLLPPAYLEALSSLQDDVAQVDFEDIERIVEEELGLPIQKAYEWFDPNPMACASLGQVHHARLRNGKEVAVKVQRPDIAAEIEQHIAAMRDIAKTFEATTEIGKRYRFCRIIDTLEDNLVRELDYRFEARHAATFAENLKEFDVLTIPQAVTELTTQRVLTMDFVEGKKITDLSGLALMELDREHLANELFRSYLHQVLVDGFFHADPHPGNLLLTSDGKIALIDFGMSVRISTGERDNLMKLLLTISEGRGEDAAKTAMAMGIEGDEFNRDEFIEKISRVVSDNQEVPLEQMQAGSIVMQIQRIAADTGMLVPNSLVMLGKTMLNLDRVVATLQPDFDPHQAMRSACTKLVHKRSENGLSLGRIYHSMLDATEFMQCLPERMNRITELLADNQLKVDVDAIDEKYLMKGLQKIANRITTGVILAALIIGASLLMRLDTSLTLFGYPAIAMGFFLTAGLIGLFMVIRMITSDEN